MQGICIVRESSIERTPRVMQMESIFDVPPRERDALTWQVDLPLDARDWNVGLIVGHSGCGKSTIINEIFKKHIAGEFDWPEDKSILDAFPSDMGIKDVTTLLSSVGFSSPLAWVRPYHVLSTGEKFRVTMARVLAENTDLAVVDEFTSVVDRTVAQIGSHAIAKTVRKRKQKFIAVTCHYDVMDWLQPDWVYCPVENSFEWRFLQPRPKIKLDIVRVRYTAWKIFQAAHYLSRDLHRAARCFMAIWENRPVAFAGLMAFPHVHLKNAYRGHRLVCLPDYQGVSIGAAMADFCGAMLGGVGKSFYVRTSHPGEKARILKSNAWRVINAPKPGTLTAMGKGIGNTKKKQSARKNRRIYRPVISAVYEGEKYPEEEAKRIWDSQPMEI